MTQNHVNLVNVRASYDERDDVVRVTSDDPSLVRAGGSLNLVVRRGSSHDVALRRLIAESAPTPPEVLVASLLGPVPATPPVRDLAALPAPRPGFADVTVALGTELTDTSSSVVYDFLVGEEPHLLFVGSPGSGHEESLRGAVVELDARNGRGELELRLVETSGGLGVTLSNEVSRVGPGPELLREFVELLEWVVEETDRRYTLLGSYSIVEAEDLRLDPALRPLPGTIKKLGRARALAVEDSLRERTRLEDHPLYLPYVVIVVDEVAPLFSEPSVVEGDLPWRAVRAATSVARLSRAAGVFLVLGTAHPKSASVPSTVRRQMARVGFRTEDEDASRVAIGTEGLESLDPLTGVLSRNGRYGRFLAYAPAADTR